MKTYTGTIKIQRYQLEDTVNILLENDYVLQIEKSTIYDKYVINIYEKNDENKKERNDN